MDLHQTRLTPATSGIAVLSRAQRAILVNRAHRVLARAAHRQSVADPGASPRTRHERTVVHASVEDSEITQSGFMFDPQTTPPEPVSLTWLPVDPEPADPPSTPDAPLTRAISFGPAMLRRLDQLGYCTLSDLAHANPNRLRADLGEISRLLDIDRWIDKARDALQHHTNPRAACAA